MAKPTTGNPKQGFKVATRAKQGAYTGKAKKIKQTLIQKAKLKKSYYKLLKREGYGSEPVPSINVESKGSPEQEEDEGDLHDLLVEREEEERPPEDHVPEEESANHSKLHTSRRKFVPPTKADKRAREKEREMERKERGEEKQRRIEEAQRRRDVNSSKWKEKTRRGQPKLGKRVDVLLDQIQRRGL